MDRALVPYRGAQRSTNGQQSTNGLARAAVQHVGDGNKDYPDNALVTLHQSDVIVLDGAGDAASHDRNMATAVLSSRQGRPIATTTPAMIVTGAIRKIITTTKTTTTTTTTTTTAIPSIPDTKTDMREFFATTGNAQVAQHRDQSAMPTREVLFFLDSSDEEEAANTAKPNAKGEAEGRGQSGSKRRRVAPQSTITATGTSPSHPPRASNNNNTSGNSNKTAVEDGDLTLIHAHTPKRRAQDRQGSAHSPTPPSQSNVVSSASPPNRGLELIPKRSKATKKRASNTPPAQKNACLSCHCSCAHSHPPPPLPPTRTTQACEYMAVEVRRSEITLLDSSEEDNSGRQGGGRVQKQEQRSMAAYQSTSYVRK